MRWGLLVSAALHGGTLCAVGAAWQPPDQRERGDLRVAVVLPSATAGRLYQPGRRRAPAVAAPPAPARSGARRLRTRSLAAAPPVPARDVAAADDGSGGASGLPADTGGGSDPAGAEQRRRALLAYIEQVVPPINARAVYSDELERLGLEGSFVVRIAVDRGGRLVDARLVGRAPHQLLQRSALAALAASLPLPPPPPELGAVVEVDVPFVYRLDGNG